MIRRVSFYCGGKHVPASRFRVAAVADRLRDFGWSPEINYGFGEWDHRIGQRPWRKMYRAQCRLLRAGKTAVSNTSYPTVIQRLAWPWSSLPERVLAARGGAIVFDFDDAIFLGHNALATEWRTNAVAQLVRESAHVVTGNSWLAEQLTTNAPVSVIPTCIDTNYYKPIPRREASKIRVGWIGTHANLRYLESIVPVLRRLKNDFAQVEFAICSDEKPVSLINETGAEFAKWSTEIELPFLRSLDVGVMPLQDDSWCRGKCSFKIIQYMAVGCSVVASPVGFNKDVVSHGREGFLVSPNEWYDALSRLILDPELRLRTGQSARKTAVERFDLSIAVRRYNEILRPLC